MIFTATSDGWLDLGGRRVRAALGPAGVKPAAEKREGDLASPIGVWPIREVIYRPDRGPPPATEIRVRAMVPDDGWCDDPDHADYNRQVRLPHPARHEQLWRQDAVYDLIGVLGWNDAPVLRGAGSAIFLHLARPDFAPTEGCVALPLADVLALLAAGLSAIRVTG